MGPWSRKEKDTLTYVAKSNGVCRLDLILFYTDFLRWTVTEWLRRSVCFWKIYTQIFRVMGYHVCSTFSNGSERD